MELSETAKVVLEKRYLLKNERGEPIETPDEMLWRVANAVAQAEEGYGGDVKEWAKKFHDIMDRQEFMPNSPTLMNAGTPLGQLSACFVIPVDDSIDGIFKALWDMAKVQKSGGGCIDGNARIIYWNDEEIHIETLKEMYESYKYFGEFYDPEYNRWGIDVCGKEIYVRSFDLTKGDVAKGRVTHLWKYELDESVAKYEITTNKGTKILTSPWHPFFVFTEDMEIKTKRADEIESGDMIISAIPQNLRSFIEDCWITGFIAGDGCMEFINKKTRYTCNRLKNYTLLLEKKYSKKFAYQEDRKMLNRIEKGIPKEILRKGDNAVLSFIAGIFDAKGHVSSKPGIEICVKNKALIEDIVYYLNSLGIKARIRKKKKKDGVDYVINIEEYTALLIFYSLIGKHLRNTEKRRKLEEIIEHRKGGSFGLDISFEAFKKWAEKFNVRFKTNGSQTLAVLESEVFSLGQWHKRGKVSKAKLVKFLTRLSNHTESEEIFKLLGIIISLEVVKNVKKTYERKTFYDLTVENYQNYLAGENGLVFVHNTGFSFSRLRPKGDIVRSTMGVASGPVSFMKIFDAATEQIKQGGKRRGANMGVLNVHHPDIEEFITAKWEEGVLRNFNISVAVTDKFMEALLRDDEYELINPRTGKVVKKVKSRKIFNLIVEGAWRNGEPGLIFIDEINRHNPTPHLGEIEATNPCLTADTWIMTSEGARQVKDLIGRKFTAVINGKRYDSDVIGFFFTGVRKVLKLKTKEGFEVRLTEDHPVLKAKKIMRHAIETEWCKAGELKKGDKVVLNNHRGLSWGGDYSEEEGYLIGLLLGDGTIRERPMLSSWGKSVGAKSVRKTAYSYALKLPHRSGWIRVKGRNEYRMSIAYLKKLATELGLRIGEKKITEKMEKASSDFYIGLLRGLFDADGTVVGDHKKGVSVRLTQSDLEFLKAVQRMLLRLGILSKIYHRQKAGKSLLSDGKGENELVISNDSVVEFYERIGFNDIEKMEKLRKVIEIYKRHPNSDRFVATVDEVIPDGIEDVYDVRIPYINAFDANGFVVHNCGEQPLLPYESCNLGSINLARFVNEKKKDFDWDRLREVVWIATRFLDDVIDVNAYPIPEIEEMTKKTRKIGLGVMGWADALFKLGIPYDSEEALKLAEKVMKFIQEESHKASQNLAEERGVFPAWKGSVWEKKGIKMRNATTTTIAPTGTISIIAGCSSGIEPVFALAYKRKNILDGEEFFEVNKVFEQKLKELGLFTDEILSKVVEEGSIQSIEEIPKDVRRVFKCALDIAPEWHVRMQAAFQKWTDNAVSKTINLPNHATKADVEKAFLLAYELKCKGITVYRDGSREEQVLAIKKTERKKEEEKIRPPARYHKPRPRPKITRGVTIETKTGCGSLYVTINEDDEGIAEVFVQLGKSGGCAASQTEAIGRLLSIALRSWVDPESLIKQLKGIRCPSIGFDNGEIITSCADGVAKALEKHLKGEYKKIKLDVKGVKPLTEFVKETEEEKTKTKMIGGVCPECGNVLEYGEGCATCRFCGFTKCG